MKESFQEPILNEQEEKIIHTMGINNCGGRCIIDAHVKEGKITGITTDTNKGSLEEPPLCACIRGLNYHKTYLDQNTRLTTPLIRTGKRGSGEFREVTWEEAISYVTKEWIRIRDTYGPGSRYVNYGWGVSATVTPIGLAKRLLSLDGGFLDHYNNYSNACVNTISPYVYGTKYVGNSLSELCNSKVIVLWGHNPAETRFDANMYYLREAKKRGAKIICIDPRYHDTAKVLQTDWYAIRPTTDAALADALAYVLIENHLYDEFFINTYCQGFTKETMPEEYKEEEDYFSYVLGKRDHCPKTPQWAEKITGLSAEKIIELAFKIANARPCAIIQGYGPQRNAYGEQSARGIMMLAALTGNVGISGGWSGGSLTRKNPPTPSMPEVENPFGTKIAVYTYIDAITHGTKMGKKEGVKFLKTSGDKIGELDNTQNVSDEYLTSNIKMILSLAGNSLINQHGDINYTKKVLEDDSLCELIVCSDLFMTPSARYADVILPAISFLEMNNITSPWTNGDFIGFNNKVVEPFYNCRFEYDWLKEIARNLGIYEAFTQGHDTVDEWLFACYEELRKTVTYLPEYDIIKQKGIYRYHNWPEKIAFEEQIKDIKEHSFETPSGKIEIFSTQLFQMKKEDIPAIPKYLSAKEGPDTRTDQYPIQLVGYHTKRRCHSIHDSNKEMEKYDPQAVHINEKDAADRGIKDGDIVYVYNARGRIRIVAKVEKSIMQGVASMPQGAWYTPDQSGIDIRGNINTLTSLQVTPLAKGNPQHTILVQIRKIDISTNQKN